MTQVGSKMGLEILVAPGKSVGEYDSELLSSPLAAGLYGQFLGKLAAAIDAHDHSTGKGAVVKPLHKVTATDTAAYAALATDDIILYSGVTSVTLPTTGLTAGQVMTVKNVGSDATIAIITGNAAEMSGSVPLTGVAAAETSGGFATFVWSGTAWWLLDYRA